MVKKFDEFEYIQEANIIKSIKDYFSKEKPKEEKESDTEDYPIMSGPELEPIEKQEFPCVYSFMTKELEERLRKRDEPIAIVNHGYSFYCETPEELEEKKKRYKVGNTYNGETIVQTHIGPERNY